MVDTIDTTQAQYFIPELWANTALEILRSNIVIAPRVTSDSDVASFTRGDVLHIPYPGTLAAYAKSAGTAYTLSQPTGETEVQVTLDQHYAVSFVIEDVVAAQANQDLMTNYSAAAAIALAENIEGALFTTLTGSSKNYGTYGTDLSFDGLLGAWKTMTDNKCPAGQRFAAISTKDIVKLVGDTDIQNWAAFSRGNQIASSPLNLGPLAGFDEVLASQLVPVVAATPDQTKNVAWRRDGAILAMRGLPTPPAGTGAVAANVRDPESGIVLRSLMSYNASVGGVQVTLEALYGTKILQNEKTLLLKS